MPGLDALGQRDLLLGREQRDLADLLEVHADRIEAPALGVRRRARRCAPPRARRIGLVVRRPPARRGARPRRSRSDGAPCDATCGGVGVAGRARRPRRWSSSFSSSAISSSTLMPPRLEHVPEVAQLVGVGFEIGERREDLAGRDEAALLDLLEHRAHLLAVVGRLVRVAAAATRAASSTVARRDRRRRSRSAPARERRAQASPSSVIHVTNCSAASSAESQCSDALAFASASSIDLTSERTRVVTPQHRREQPLT